MILKTNVIPLAGIPVGGFALVKIEFKKYILKKMPLAGIPATGFFHLLKIYLKNIISNF